MIIPLSQIRLVHLDKVGGKAANLGELIATGLPVPPGFVVPGSSYRDAIDDAWPDIEEALTGGDPDAARRIVEAVPLPDGLPEALAAGLAELDDEPVAVRSSATAEDLVEASFAGQQETYLGVVGADAVLAAVRRCWGSMWTPRSIAYRERNGFAHRDVDLAVVVQQMIAAEAAGVAFTADPVTGRAGEIAIDASWGLGESVVSGAVTPDAWLLRTGRIVQRTLGAKQTRIDLAASGEASTRETAPADRGRFCLSDARVGEVAALAERVRAHYDREMDIEWALGAGRLWLLQARPITTPVTAERPASAEGSHRRGRASRLGSWLHDDIVEHFPSPYPLDVAVVELGAGHLIRAMGLAGVRVIAPDGLVRLDADGIARATHPKIRLWGVPCGLFRVLRTRPVDPASWDTGPGREVAAAIAGFVRTDVAELSEAGLASRFEAIWAAADRMLSARFGEYLPFQVIWGAQLEVLLRLAGRRELSQYDLLTDLDFATVVIDRGLRGLAADAAGRPAVAAALAARPIDLVVHRIVTRQGQDLRHTVRCSHGWCLRSFFVSAP